MTGRKKVHAVERGWTRILWMLRWIGLRPGYCVPGFAVLGFVGAVLVGFLDGLPVPRMHDEFSYILSGETFASGRLTNPPHPFWQFFETFHVLQQPTYSSKYPPGQGLWLALGEVLFSEPAWGVWLSVAAASAAICWMLLAWLPSQWAVVAGLFFVLNVAWVSYWGQSYWGGAVAAIGGALATGAFRRLWDRPTWSLGMVLGVGFGVLAISRPLEGFLLALMIALALLFRIQTMEREDRRALAVRGLLGASLATGVFLCGLGIHNEAVTDSPITMPYQVYQKEYSSRPLFIFRESRPLPEYRHAEMRDYAVEWGDERARGLWGLWSFPASLLSKVARLAFFYMGPGVLALVGLIHLRRRRWSVFAFGGVAVILTIVLLTAGSYAHYLAPVTGLVYVLMGVGLAALHRRARARRGADLSLIAAGVLVLVVLFRVIIPSSPGDDVFPRNRVVVSERLQALPGRDLVFVEYRQGHSFHDEWVYNHADIDGSEIVWARSMGSIKNSELIQYYPNRTVWMLTVADSIDLRHYPDPSD